MSIRTALVTSIQGVLEGKGYWNEWERLAKTNNQEVQVDFSKFTPDRYLLSHCTAVGGVELEPDGHTIVVPHGKWVNSNGNAWSNKVLLNSYKSFIWAENYLEHVQIKEFSKGKVIDAVAWVVYQQEEGYKEKIPTVFVDCLIATNKKKHPKLVNDIKSGKLGAVSMGCSITHSQCSKCGKVIEEGHEACTHVKHDLGKMYRDSKASRRVVAELCGVPDIKDSNIFVELSFVRQPAFTPAIRHDKVKAGTTWTGKPIRAFVPADRFNTAAPE